MEHFVKKDIPFKCSGKTKADLIVYRSKDSWDLYNGLKALTNKHTHVEENDMIERGEFTEWSGATSKEQAERMLHHGSENMKLLEQVRSYVTDVKGGTPIEKLRQIAYRPNGCVPCIPKVLTGNPNDMIVLKMKKTRQKIIRIAVDSAISGGMPTEKFAMIGSVIARAIADVETAGYRVRLYAVDITNSYDGQLLANCLLVKGENEPMNIQRMMYPMCEASYPRIVGFTLINRADDWRKNNSLGMIAFGDQSKDEIRGIYDAVTGGDCIVLNMQMLSNEIEKANAENVMKIVDMIFKDEHAGNYTRNK